MSESNDRTPKTPTFNSCVIAAAFHGIQAGEAKLVELMQHEASEGGKYAAISELVLDVSEAIKAQPRRMKFVEDSGFEAEPWSVIVHRLMDGMLTNEKLAPRAAEFVDDVARCHVLPPDILREMRAKLPKRERRSYTEAEAA